MSEKNVEIVGRARFSGMCGVAHVVLLELPVPPARHVQLGLANGLRNAASVMGQAAFVAGHCGRHVRLIVRADADARSGE